MDTIDGHSPYDQTGFDHRFGWGRRAVRDAVTRGDVIVIVDVLSFSTAVAAGVAHGATIFPFEHKDERTARAYASHVGAELRTAALDADATRRALSPRGFSASDAGKAWVLCSPNGATCSRIASTSPAVFAGALVNASAVAAAAQAVGGPIAVVACGELWNEAREGENVLRPALEDALGAGAILAALEGSRSPEARVAAAGFEVARDHLENLIHECASGRELLEHGHAGDVAFSARLDALEVAPRLREGAYTAGA